ncbi:tetratricopeptide repeat protein [Ancylostoma duodenale]|uniref:Tetratricopeptide repeat protein n=1 Tax=Ancylostoma duodenale TaxID=51022 RepID=A0A0C2GLX2_9BILA|nr:tetratricopeptide repeat protein [Ancylostoma duodenale]
MLCQLAQIEQALNRPERAMRLTDRALALDPDDVACRYNRARLLFDTKRNEECVKELNELKEVSPDEAYIYHLLGSKNFSKMFLLSSLYKEMFKFGK